MRCIRIHRARRYVPCVATMLALCAMGTKAGAQQTYPPPNYPAGQHDIAARICTSHGECGMTKATVLITSSASTLQLAATKSLDKASRKGKVLDAVLQAARVLIR